MYSIFQVLLDALTAGGLGNVTIYNRGINGGFISYVQPGMRSRRVTSLTGAMATFWVTLVAFEKPNSKYI